MRETSEITVTPNRTTARCAIAGGGPAGLMLALLLARAGVDVLVLEKHADFLRDFRGDTVHPSTLDVLHEIGPLLAGGPRRLRAPALLRLLDRSPWLRGLPARAVGVGVRPEHVAPALRRKDAHPTARQPS